MLKQLLQLVLKLPRKSLNQFAEQFVGTFAETYAAIFVKTLTEVSSDPLFHHKPIEKLSEDQQSLQASYHL